MAAPEYVPRPGGDRTRYYESPPRRPESWLSDRPGELDAHQPEGLGFGVQGPDQGYALRLARQYEAGLVLQGGEDAEDALAGAVQIGLRRAALNSRAPVKWDIEVGLRVFGFLDEDPAAELVELRRSAFEGVAHHHHYPEMRTLVTMVPDSTLRMSHTQVASEHARDWRAPLGLVVDSTDLFDR